MNIYESLYFIKEISKIILPLKNQMLLIYKKYLYFNRDIHIHVY